MTRRGKLIRNLVVTAVVLALFFPVCGVYVNPENCALDSARALYYGDCTVRGWGDAPDGERIYFLTNEEGAIYLCKVRRSFGLFWTTGSAFSGGNGWYAQEGVPVYIGRIDGGGSGSTVWCLRYFEEAQTLAWYGKETSVWHGDVAMLSVPQVNAAYEPVEVYDAEGELLWTDTYS